MKFLWELDNWWWEIIRFDEFGLPKSWNFILPDKLIHFLICFILTWVFYRWVGRHWAVIISMVIMIAFWEFLWDGCFRYGASWKDIVADILGSIVCWWWLASYNIIGQMDKV